MEVDQAQVDALVLNPSEGLNVDLKRWIDPNDPAGIAKIVRACLALRNRNGGFLVIGFDNTTLQPDTQNQPTNIRTLFHLDDIQGLVSKYAQEVFEIAVAFSVRDGIDHPVIAVPTGVQVPVAAKRNLLDPSGRPLVSKGDVYFRTLEANGTPSTSVAHPEDWREIVQICFDNREADIGRFLRRQLSALDRQGLGAALQELGLLVGSTTPFSPSISLREETDLVQLKGEAQFAASIERRNPSSDEKALADVLTLRIALVVRPGWSSRVPDHEFLSKTLGGNPRYTGWPIWLDARSSANIENRPKLVSKAWEALVIATGGWSQHMDFMRLDPRGDFFLRRSMPDDLTDRVPPGTAMDPIIAILRVAEAIAVGISMSRALIGDGEPHRLGFRFHWNKLDKRALAPWANPLVMMLGEPQAQDDEVVTFVELPSDTPIPAIAPFVDDATRDLFATFDGERIPLQVIEHWTSRLIERRL
jgi:hypothetical protein